MIPVILAGNPGDRGVCDYLLRLLPARGGVFYVGERAVSGNSSARFLLLEMRHIPVMETGGGILIFKQTYSGGAARHAAGFTGIVDSAHSGALAMLKESGIPAVTCGMSARDTLTLSSITPGSAAVTLSRSLLSLSGFEVEPQDIPVTLDEPADAFAVMAGAAVLLLAGNGKQRSRY